MVILHLCASKFQINVQSITTSHVQQATPTHQLLTHHYYPQPEKAIWQTVLYTLLKNTWGSIKNLYPHTSCPVTLHQVTFWVWKMIGHHCGSWENLAVSWLAIRWRGEFFLSQVKCSGQRLWNWSCLCVELF